MTPVVRYMIVCDDYRVDPKNARRVIVEGLVTNIRVTDSPRFPHLHRQLAVFLALSDIRKSGELKIRLVHVDHGAKTWESEARRIAAHNTPLDVVGVGFRISGLLFPDAGLYQVQFLFDDQLVEERPVLLR